METIDILRETNNLPFIYKELGLKHVCMHNIRTKSYVYNIIFLIINMQQLISKSANSAKACVE